MKNFINTIGLLIFISSCNTNTVTIPKSEYNQLKGIKEQPKPDYPKDIIFNDGIYNTRVQIIIIDSCEYIVYHLGSTVGAFSHKGNCKFCKFRNNH